MIARLRGFDVRFRDMYKEILDDSLEKIQTDCKMPFVIYL